jgi:hypothetical protein
MKKYLLASALLFSAFSALSSSARDDFAASLDPLISLSSNANARLGMSREQLLDQLGQPSEKLADSLWVYSDFRAKGRPVAEQCDTLVVVFTGERVSLLRLTDAFLVKAAIAKARANAAKPTTVAKK